MGAAEGNRIERGTVDPEFLKREDRFARHTLTGMIASACTWAMTIFGLSDTVIPYLLPVVLLLSCGMYMAFGRLAYLERPGRSLFLWCWWL